MPRTHVLVPLTLLLAGCFDVDDLTQPLVDANTEILERQAANEQDIATLYMMATELQASVAPLADALEQIEQTRSDLEALQADLDALALRAATVDEVAALQTTADALQTDLDNASTRLTTLENADIATMAWVTDQGFASASTTADLDTRVTSVEASQLTLASDMSAVVATASDLDTRLASQEAVAVQALADFDALSTTVDGIQEDLATGSDDLSNAQEDLSGLQTTIEDLQTTVQSTSDTVTAHQTTLDGLTTTTAGHTSQIATATTDIAALQVTSDGHSVLLDALSTDLDALTRQCDLLEDDLGALEGDFVDLRDDLPAFALALYESTTDGGERTVAGRQGLQLKTADGAFYLSGSMTGTDFASDTIHRVTLYVANPTDDDITVDLQGCSGDATDLFVDGTLHTAADDHDGACDATWTVTFAPGSHTVSLRSQDVDAHNEGFGIGAGWVTTSGLTFDLQAFEAAGANDPVR